MPRNKTRYPTPRAGSRGSHASRDRRDAVALVTRGQELHARGRLDDAARCYRQALSRDPKLVTARTALGSALWGLDCRPEAIAQFEEAVALAPDAFEPARCLADAYYVVGQQAAALKYYLQAAAADQQCAAVFSNLGALLRQMGYPREALRALNRALTLAPADPGALVNSGLACQDLGDVQTALSCYELAIAARSDHNDALWDRAIVLLLTGDFARGWAAHEHRTWVIERAGKLRTFSQPRWDGSPLDGRRILIHAEQGIGDQLQFVRFARRVKRLGGTVIVECHPALVRLIAGCEGIDELVPAGGPLPAFDVYLPVMSLPHALGTGAEFLGAEVPYLSAPGPCPAPVAAALKRAPGLTVGLVWAGEPAHTNDRNRSVGLQALLPLLDVPGVSFVSLQKGAGAAALAELAPQLRDRLPDLGATFADFADTAHAVERLDLVIAVDTSVVHLAGALGKPVWVLLPFMPDWRWMLDRTDTPWYPSARLFRQRERGDWAGVVAAVDAALRELVASGRAPGSGA
jgi:Tfp pilus assembly protein PilF